MSVRGFTVNKISIYAIFYFNVIFVLIALIRNLSPQFIFLFCADRYIKGWKRVHHEIVLLYFSTEIFVICSRVFYIFQLFLVLGVFLG